ncbi:Uncharacterised protein [Mycobacteroides abscessus subsp. abscessus]|nr:Uncharacterised protein [Mycobacteroides abscessus subsp. abscessus]SKW63634.1 Uncharacterised protein [Mycobacteroides abscessus subsp. abscessus]
MRHDHRVGTDLRGDRDDIVRLTLQAVFLSVRTRTVTAPVDGETGEVTLEFRDNAGPARTGLQTAVHQHQ